MNNNNNNQDISNGIIDFRGFRAGRMGRRILTRGMGGGSYQKFKIFSILIKMVETIPKFKFKSVSGFIIIIQTLMFAITYIDYYLGQEKWRCVLHKYGIKYGPSIGSDLEYYRLLTALFLHQNIQHILINSFSIMVLGSKIEKKIGKLSYLVIYLFSGIFGNLFAVFINYQKFALGASTAAFGLMGCKLNLIIFSNQLNEDKRKKELKRFLLVLFMNFYVSFSIENVEKSAHFGGLLFGFLISILLQVKIKLTQKIIITGFMIVLVSLLFQQILYMGYKQDIKRFSSLQQQYIEINNKKQEVQKIFYCDKQYDYYKNKSKENKPNKKNKNSNDKNDKEQKSSQKKKLTKKQKKQQENDKIMNDLKNKKNNNPIFNMLNNN